MGINTDAVRNIALAGHGGTGKTTLLEQMLFAGGSIARPEPVASGKTVSDSTDEEIERKISIHLSSGHITWKEKGINILDTPGASDFVGEVVSAFRVAEAAVLVVGAKEGVQIETVKLWRRLNSLNMPRIIFINKLDTERADFQAPVDDMKEKFNANIVPVVIPLVGSGGFSGVVDLIENKAYTFAGAGEKETVGKIPDDMADTVEEYRLALIEAAAEGDDSLTEKYLEEETLSEEDIKKGLKEGFAQNKFVPVVCGAAELSSGVVPLLNFISEIAPSPEATIETGKNSDDEEINVQIDAGAPFSCFVYKTSIDQFSGKMSFIKVISGTVKADLDAYNPRARERQRIGKVFRALGKKLDDVTELCAGDLGVLTKLDSASTDDTFCMQDHIVSYMPLQIPQPVHSVAVSAASKKDEDKMNQFLQRAAAEDLTFQMRFNPETKQTVISGMGELHISMILKGIKEKQNIEIETQVPKVPYRETITKSAEAEYTHKKQTGGHGQYGKVVLQIKPLARGEKYSFENVIKGGSISKGYIPGVEKGIIEGMETGILAGYPVVDLGAVIVDGKEHTVDSSEMSFKLAAKGAVMAAMEKAGSVLLEPVVNLHVYTNDENVGDILSDLSSRRGRVLGQEAVGGGIAKIDAQVPQAELLRYSIDLRSITSGTASFEMEFSHYNPISGKIAEDVIKATKTTGDV